MALAKFLLECSKDIRVSFAREIFSKLGAFCQQWLVGDLVARRGGVYVLDELSEYHSELGQVLLVYDGPNGVDGAL